MKLESPSFARVHKAEPYATRSTRMNRREFIRTGAAGLGAAALGFAGQAGGSKPLRVGLIGCGWYGKCDLFRLIQVSPVEVVSLCDVDRRMLAEAADLMAVRQASHKKPRTFSDYRPMLAEKDLDIVLVGTPDHWHALAMIAAVKAGAHVYRSEERRVGKEGRSRW